MTSATNTLTSVQERALLAAVEKGGAWYGRQGNAMGGAFRRVCEALAQRGLVEGSAPFPITDAGRAALAAVKAARREKAYRRGECWAMEEVRQEREAERRAQSAQQPAQQQQANAGRRSFLRSALATGLLASTVAPAAAVSVPVASMDRHTVPTLRGDDTKRLPAHGAFWSGLPLPFTPAEAWHLLSPATQAEIGAAVIGMHLAQYIHGDSMAEADCFRDDALREAASEVEHDILNRMDDRLWTLFPDLYGPDGDHPRWALAAGMVHPLGTVLPEREIAPAYVAEPDPVFAAIAAWQAADRDVMRVYAETASDDSAAANARCDAEDRRRDGLEKEFGATTPTTLAGSLALARHYAATSIDPEGAGLPHLVEALAALAHGDEGDAA